MSFRQYLEIGKFPKLQRFFNKALHFIYKYLFITIPFYIAQMKGTSNVIQIVSRQVLTAWKHTERKTQKQKQKVLFTIISKGFMTPIKSLTVNNIQCWTVGAIFTFGRSRMFGSDKLRPSAVDRSRSRRIKKCKTYTIKVLISNQSN